jgi:hypothetical protein
MRRKASILGAILAIAALGTLAVGTATAGRSDLNAARGATGRFHDIANATAAGYGQPPAPAPLHECISSFNNTGAMGFHFINGGLLDANVDATTPEALVYAPDRNGNLKLVAVEYVVFQSAWDAAHPGTTPELFGQMFMLTPSPNRFEIPAFYALHAWLWDSNPSGMFAPFNPSVSCSGASAAATVAASAADTANLAAALGPRIAAVGDGTRRIGCAIPAAIA